VRRRFQGTLPFFCDLLFLILLINYEAAGTHQRGSHLASISDVQSADETRSVTGTISTVRENSFTLSVASAFSSDEQHETTPKTMVFVLDKNTTIDGKLRVGANADVTYREENGANIAINVRAGT
jgi:hypothetical protein